MTKPHYVYVQCWRPRPAEMLPLRVALKVSRVKHVTVRQTAEAVLIVKDKAS